MKRRSLFILVLAASLFAAAAYLLLAHRQAATDTGEVAQALFPGLEEQLNSINRIRIEHRGSSYDIVRDGEQWLLPAKADYPVLFERVKQLLIGMALLEKMEAKTGKEQNYARLGVQEPAADTDNYRIEFYQSEAEPLASVIIGYIRGAMFAANRDGIYARRSGDTQSWLVAGNLQLPTKQIDWIDREIIHVAPKAVHTVSIRYPDGSVLELKKLKKGYANFIVSNRPEGSELTSQKDVNVLARGLAHLKMEDLFPRSQVKLPETDPVVTVYETWDGLRVTVYSVEEGGRILAWLEVGVAPLDVTDLVQARTTANDVAAMQARLNGWIYEIPGNNAEKLRARLEDILKKDAQ